MEPDNQAKMRADLRVKYMEAASRLIQALDSPQAKHAYLTHELTNLGVSLRSFDPNDQDSLLSKAYLFQPLSSEAFGEYSLRESDIEETGWGAISYYLKFDEIYDRPVVDVEHHERISSQFLYYGGESRTDLRAPEYPLYPLQEEGKEEPGFFL